MNGEVLEMLYGAMSGALEQYLGTALVVELGHHAAIWLALEEREGPWVGPLTYTCCIHALYNPLITGG